MIRQENKDKSKYVLILRQRSFTLEGSFHRQRLLISVSSSFLQQPTIANSVRESFVQIQKTYNTL